MLQLQEQMLRNCLPPTGTAGVFAGSLVALTVDPSAPAEEKIGGGL